MLVPHDNERVRSVQVSGQSLRFAGGIAAIVLLILGALSTGFFVKSSQHLRAERLQQQNEVLAQEVDRMRGMVSTLTARVEDLTAKDEKFRVMAGLPAIDAETRQVGIGGPGTAVLESSALYAMNPSLGEKTFAASYDLSTLLRRADLLSSSMDETLEVMHGSTERLRATPTRAPIDGHLTSLFSPNRRHPILRIRRPHNGIDIAAPTGEPILAPAAGRVIFSGTKSGGYGRTVEIDHGHGIVTLYAHASRLLVRRGDRVERGQTIAEVGSSGLATGPHLHYEVHVDGEPIDPLNFIIWDADLRD